MGKELHRKWRKRRQSMRHALFAGRRLFLATVVQIASLNCVWYVHKGIIGYVQTANRN